MQTLNEETRDKARLGKKLTHMDLGSMFVPLGSTNGTTNAVMFGVVLMGFRDADLNLVFHADRPVAKLTNHDMDAPPWWHFQRKKMLYIDGFAEKGHRRPDAVHAGQGKRAREVPPVGRGLPRRLRLLESLRAAQVSLADRRAAGRGGEQAFGRNCAACHGTYGRGGRYPEKLVPIDVVGPTACGSTRSRRAPPPLRPKLVCQLQQAAGDRRTRRLHRPAAGRRVGQRPYFHNGAVPTLWHVLHPTSA